MFRLFVMEIFFVIVVSVIAKMPKFLFAHPRCWRSSKFLLQKKAMRIISFASFDADTLPVFGKLNIIKFPDLISFSNCLFIYKHFLSKSPSVFSNVFVLRSNTDDQNTRLALHGLLTKPSCKTSKYGINAFAGSAIKSWNFFQKRFSNNSLYQLSYSQPKLLTNNHFFKSFNEEYS